jgi:hypothetical protein
MTIKSPYVKDLTGQRFGHLLVQSFAFVKKRHAHWNVTCDCGQECVKNGGQLADKTYPIQFCTQQCSLLLEFKSKALSKHGLSRHLIYGIWANMIQRCHNSSNPRFKNYGGRGIKVCEEWRESFEAFFTDMGHTWGKGLQIDRINNEDDYSPINCKWSTPKENMANRRNSVLTSEQLLAARRHGVSRHTLYHRIKKGWPLQKALSHPVQLYKPRRKK